MTKLASLLAVAAASCAVDAADPPSSVATAVQAEHGACTAQPSVELEGPVDYNTSAIFFQSALHLTVNGSATLHVQGEDHSPADLTGNTSAAALSALREDIGAADLGSLSSEYPLHAAFSRPLVVEVGGATTQIQVDEGISNAQLPAELGKVFQDMDAIAMQLSLSTGS